MNVIASKQINGDVCPNKLDNSLHVGLFFFYLFLISSKWHIPGNYDKNYLENLESKNVKKILTLRLPFNPGWHIKSFERI